MIEYSGFSLHKEKGPKIYFCHVPLCCPELQDNDVTWKHTQSRFLPCDYQTILTNLENGPEYSIFLVFWCIFKSYWYSLRSFAGLVTVTLVTSPANELELQRMSIRLENVHQNSNNIEWIGLNMPKKGISEKRELVKNDAFI